MNRFFLLFAFLAITTHSIFAQDSIKQKDPLQMTDAEKRAYYKPKFSATLLCRYEFNPRLDAHHFQIRHARVGVNGDLHPMFSYHALADLAYGGKISIVCLLAHFKPVKGLTLTIGYDKLPFSTENLLSPYKYYFSDKSFLTQYVTGWSDAGATLTYQWDKVVPFRITAGVFNTHGFAAQMEWQKTLSYVTRGEFNLFRNFNLTLNYGYIAAQGDTMQSHNIGAGFTYDFYNFHWEAEYICRKHYNKNYSPTQALQTFLFYNINIPNKYLKKVSLGVRYDVISSCEPIEGIDLGKSTLRQRLTTGITLTFIESPFRGAIRLDYEKFFLSKGLQNNHDRFIVELITHF